MDNKTAVETPAVAPPAPVPTAAPDLSALLSNPQFQQMLAAATQQKAPEPVAPEVQYITGHIAGQLHFVGSELKRLNDRVEKNDKPLNFVVRHASEAAIAGVIFIGLGTCAYGAWAWYKSPS